MILPGSLEKAWIQEISKTIGKRGDPKLVEKIIFSFSLLEQLKLSGIDFIFKGGTSLFLMSETPSRFSIDVDIIVGDSPASIPAYLDKVIQSGLFLNWEDDNDRKSSETAPVGHYKFFYESRISQHFGDEPILLDILFTAKPGYPNIKNIPIKHKWLLTNDPFEIIKVPSFESLLGDKLTAFAPSTTGILYSKNRPIEIIKQLFDIAYLFDKAIDFQEIKESFLNIAGKEIAYRKLSITYKDVLQDAFDTAFLITSRDYSSENFNFLQKGISNIVNFIIAPFKIEDAIICASKVAYLTQAIRQNSFIGFAQFKSPEDIAEFTITQKEFAKLNRLKKVIPEAFFYWHHALGLP
jgi:hypothetical protein